MSGAQDPGLPPNCEGMIVTRGGSRVEKLIKCDLCGNIYRTSNMARHKKRYCKAKFSNNSFGRQLAPKVSEHVFPSIGTGEVQDFGVNESEVSHLSDSYHLE